MPSNSPAKSGSCSEHDQPDSGDEVVDYNQIPIGTLDGRIYWLNYMLGTSILLPWTAMSTASPYFLERLEGSRLQAPFVSYLSLTYTVTAFIYLAHATITTREASPSQRLRYSLGVLAPINLLLTLSPGLGFGPTGLFAFVMLIAALQGAALSYLRAAIVAVASAFGPSAVQAVMSGESVIGVLVSAVQYFTAAAAELGGDTAVGSGTKLAAFLSFGLSTACLASALAAHAWMMGVPSYRSAIQALEGDKDIMGEDGMRADIPSVPKAASRRSEIMKLAQVNWGCNFAAAYSCVLISAVFPPITSAILSVNPISGGVFFSPTLFNYFHFLVFNTADYMGRLICSHPRLITWSHKKLLRLSLARTVFIPLLLLCNFQRPGNTSQHTPPFINSDFAYLLILAAFGVSHGYLMSLCMMAASSPKHNPRIRSDQASPAATVAQFFTMGGFTLGSFASFGVAGVVCGCNPFY
ncbi:hypothetical protein BOTBODRAFT_130479 [Botryobasidium botryosum FD-172 SS1]|uniref:Nucleoside transporter n=1 Tax=Botryobasidium botryosum (strain FD-172 SS1) TaxID=930990 RepID=A0A067MW65_BOTB1|nr:hypothetical protein BOTBODRAFT_130479 [Botryobasidium botryosum FD-172 SS1]